MSPMDKATPIFKCTPGGRSQVLVAIPYLTPDAITSNPVIFGRFFAV